ncbi:hypothetical protein BC829DRAFT_396166 [Chytridium lagenaria]|nr:hypothetical protein BC829DRAFT_396166 [Chytridium lagenaria]
MHLSTAMRPSRRTTSLAGLVLLLLITLTCSVSAHTRTTKKPAPSSTPSTISNYTLCKSIPDNSISLCLSASPACSYCCGFGEGSCTSFPSSECYNTIPEKKLSNIPFYLVLAIPHTIILVISSPKTQFKDSDSLKLPTPEEKDRKKTKNYTIALFLTTALILVLIMLYASALSQTILNDNICYRTDSMRFSLHFVSLSTITVFLYLTHVGFFSFKTLSKFSDPVMRPFRFVITGHSSYTQTTTYDVTTTDSNGVSRTEQRTASHTHYHHFPNWRIHYISSRDASDNEETILKASSSSSFLIITLPKTYTTDEDALRVHLDAYRADAERDNPPGYGHITLNVEMFFDAGNDDKVFVYFGNRPWLLGKWVGVVSVFLMLGFLWETWLQVNSRRETLAIRKEIRL